MTAIPDQLHTPETFTYPVINYTSGATGDEVLVSFKYTITNHETIPMWFKAQDIANGDITLISGDTAVRIDKTGGLDVGYWNKWGSGSSDLDMLNRAALWSAMSNGQFHERAVGGTDPAVFEIKTFYTYYQYRVNTNVHSKTIVLPDPTGPQKCVRIIHENSQNTNTLTIRAANGDKLRHFEDNGGTEAGGGESDITLPNKNNMESCVIECYADDAFSADGWTVRVPVVGDLRDTNPIANIRRMSQSEYDAITPLENTLYIID